MNSEIYFNMLEQQHPISGSSSFLLKRWKKHTIYSKQGSYNRTDNPSDNSYQSGSIYLYDYVVVSDKWFYENVYTSSTFDTTPSVDTDYIGNPINKWNHILSTWKNSPNAIQNNYIWRYNSRASSIAGHPIYGYSSYYNPGGEEPDAYNALMKSPIYLDDGTYFEIVIGYPRNHYTHKRHLFSLYRMITYGSVNRTEIVGSYLRNRQTISTTVGEDGLEDGSSPVQSVQVGNLRLVVTDNVINH